MTDFVPGPSRKSKASAGHRRRRPLWFAVIVAAVFSSSVAPAPAAPQNDDFASASVFSPGGEIELAFNNEATKEPLEPDHAGNPGGASIWYRWTPKVDRLATIATCAGTLDTLLGVYTGDSVSNLTEVASNDDGCPAPEPPPDGSGEPEPAAGSAVHFFARAGTTYRIALDGRNGAEGEIRLMVTTEQTDPATHVTSTAATLNGRISCTPGESWTQWWRWRPAGGAWIESERFNWECSPQSDQSLHPLRYRAGGFKRVPLLPDTQYEFQICDTHGGGRPLCTNASGVASDPDDPSEPLDSFTTLPAPAVTTQPVDGGPDYYGQFSNPLPTSPDYFPIGAWLRPAHSQAQIDLYKDFGLNLLVGLEHPELTEAGLLRESGIKAIVQANERTRFDEIGSETSGWLLYDEIDMCCGPPGFDGGNGYQMLDDILAGLPSDNRLRFNNYGKGVMFWETDAEAARFVNAYQQVVSNDIYWFTDPNERGRPGYGVAASYGATVDRMRYLDSLDGESQPIWNFVELGWPFTESAADGGRRILPDELRAAVWHSIIAGARGILYFDHNFGPAAPGSIILGQGYSDTRAMAKSVNAQITQLAPVLNSPTVTGGVSASAGVRTLAKLSDNRLYIFAGSTGAATTATFTVPSGIRATVIGEGRSVPVEGGSFTDSFADGNAIHIYRVD